MTAIDLSTLTGEPAGVVKMFAGNAAEVPAGYLICDGSNISRTEYAALFAAIGTLHGIGDGSTTFALPNLQSRLVMGQDSSDPNFANVGNITGSPTHNHPMGTQCWACLQMGGAGSAAGTMPMRRQNTPNWTSTHSNATALQFQGESVSRATGVALIGNTDVASTIPPTVVMHFIIKT